MKRKVLETGKSYNHFSFEERERLSVELARGKTQKEIAELLGHHPSAISREIKRNGSFIRKNYLASHAEKRSKDGKTKSHARDRRKKKESGIMR